MLIMELVGFDRPPRLEEEDVRWDRSDSHFSHLSHAASKALRSGDGEDGKADHMKRSSSAGPWAIWSRISLIAH